MYKERLLKYKEDKATDLGRNKPKAKKPKPYKVTAECSIINKKTRVVIGRYSTLEDAKKAILAHKRKDTFYSDFKIEDSSRIFVSNTNSN